MRLKPIIGNNYIELHGDYDKAFPHRSGLKNQKLNNRYRYRYRSLNKFDPKYSF
jgi:hypothetical protein